MFKDMDYSCYIATIPNLEPKALSCLENRSKGLLSLELSFETPRSSSLMKTPLPWSQRVRRLLWTKPERVVRPLLLPIASPPSALLTACIVVISGGQAVEAGTHSELMKMKERYYTG